MRIKPNDPHLKKANVGQVYSDAWHWGDSMGWGSPQGPRRASSQQENQHSLLSVAPKAQPALVKGSYEIIHSVVSSSREKVFIFHLKMSNHLSFCYPYLPPIPPSITVFSNESTLYMRWPKYWSFSFSIIPSKEIPGLISFNKVISLQLK